MSTIYEHGETFTGIRDIYDGIILDFTGSAEMEEKTFLKRLENSLDKWQRESIKGVWFNVSLECSKYIPILTQHDFIFYHTSVDGRVVTLLRWLPTDIPNLIPCHAHTTIGVGGIVIDDEKNKVLVVTEKVRPKYWKFPGGYVDPEEELDKAVRREIFEETGIDTEFESLVVFRHMLRTSFNRSDLYFVAKLKPLSFTIRKDDFELKQCEWMDIDWFLNNSSALESTKNFLRLYLQYKNCGVRLEKQQYKHELLKKSYSLYSLTLGQN